MSLNDKYLKIVIADLFILNSSIFDFLRSSARRFARMDVRTESASHPICASVTLATSGRAAERVSNYQKVQAIHWDLLVWLLMY